MRSDAGSRCPWPARWTLGFVAVAVLASGCSTGTDGVGSTPTPDVRPSSPAKVAILSPTNGQVVHGSSVKIRVGLTGAKIVPATTTDIVLVPREPGAKLSDVIAPFEPALYHLPRFDVSGQARDQRGVVRRDVQQAARPPGLPQNTNRELVEIFVDVRLARVSDVRRFEVRAFHETNRRSERKERLEIAFGSV